jgi:type IV pilus assembly protein PilQ
LPSIDTKVAMREREDRILVQIMDTSLPRRLFRRLDVTEFGTPVVAIESKPSGRNVEVEIQTTSALDYRAYQTDEVLTVELRALTAAEQARRATATASPEGERLSLSFQRIEIRALLQVLADFTDLNLVASDAVDERGSLMLRLKNVPWAQALDIILEAKDLAKCQEGDLVIVGPRDELPDCQERTASPRASPRESGPRHKRDSEVALTR